MSGGPRNMGSILGRGRVPDEGEDVRFLTCQNTWCQIHVNSFCSQNGLPVHLDVLVSRYLPLATSIPK
jgi:hypothetical protein